MGRLGIAIGDKQVVSAGTPLPPAPTGPPVAFDELSFSDPMTVRSQVDDRAKIAGVQPKVPHQSRSVISGRAGRMILKLSPDPAAGVVRGSDVV